MSRPLEGIRVLDLTNVLAGPYCCHQLAHLGADVIKVEAVGRGDLARQLGADDALNQQGMGLSFLAQNAGKRSVTLDLKHAQGKALFLRLLKTADVLVENFRPGVMQRLSLDYERLKETHKDLIYCAITGFGQDGPWVHRPAYDQIIQGVSGLMSITGDSQTAPLRCGSPVADTVGGMTAAFAIAAALNAQPRGAYLDVSMLESLLCTMGWVVSNYLHDAKEPLANGNDNPTSAPSGTFRTADALINIAANKDEQWRLLIDHLGLSHLADDPRYGTRKQRIENRQTLTLALENVLRTRDSQLWVDELSTLGVPCGEILTVADILSHPQISERGLIKRYHGVPGVDTSVDAVSTGVKIDGCAPGVASSPPALGQHNEEVFTQLGLTREQIDSLAESGVI